MEVSVDNFSQAVNDFVNSVFYRPPPPAMCTAEAEPPRVAPPPPAAVPPAPVATADPVALVPNVPGAWSLAAICEQTLRNEGGYVNNPLDHGHETNHGITLAFAQAHPTYFDANGDGQVTAEDIKAMTPEMAKRAYIEILWKPYHLLEVPNVSNVLAQACDLAMNGPVQAVKILQHAVSVPVDGQLGPKSIAAMYDFAAKRGDKALNNSIVAARLHFYQQVVAAHPTDAVFLKGWNNRATRYLA